MTDAAARTIPPWCRAIAFILLLVQGVAACTSFIEGRLGVGAGSHVEAPSGARHYVHAEADCSFCAVRMVPAASPVLSNTWLASRRADRGQQLQQIERPSTTERFLYGSRAPPVSRESLTL